MSSQPSNVKHGEVPRGKIQSEGLFPEEPNRSSNEVELTTKSESLGLGITDFPSSTHTSINSSRSQSPVSPSQLMGSENRPYSPQTSAYQPPQSPQVSQPEGFDPFTPARPPSHSTFSSYGLGHQAPQTPHVSQSEFDPFVPSRDPNLPVFPSHGSGSSVLPPWNSPCALPSTPGPQAQPIGGASQFVGVSQLPYAPEHDRRFTALRSIKNDVGYEPAILSTSEPSYHTMQAPMPLPQSPSELSSAIPRAHLPRRRSSTHEPSRLGQTVVSAYDVQYEPTAPRPPISRSSISPPGFNREKGRPPSSTRRPSRLGQSVINAADVPNEPIITHSSRSTFALPSQQERTANNESRGDVQHRKHSLPGKNLATPEEGQDKPTFAHPHDTSSPKRSPQERNAVNAERRRAQRREHLPSSIHKKPEPKEIEGDQSRSAQKDKPARKQGGAQQSGKRVTFSEEKADDEEGEGEGEGGGSRSNQSHSRQKDDRDRV